MKWNLEKKILSISAAIIVANLTSTSYASDYNLPLINTSQLGSIYSGYAAEANDASTSYSNPAGLVRLKKQQLVVSAIGLMGSSRFQGTEMTPPYPFPGGSVETGGASTKLRGLVPAFYYAYPINDRFIISIGQTVPFALGTNYAKDSVVRYAATRAEILDLDFGPNLGIKLNDKFAIGIGFDVNRIIFKINNMIGLPISAPDAESQNNLYGWGYGYHAGALYSPCETTRFGLSYNSQVMVHTSGNSIIYAPPALGGEMRVTNQRVDAALPARIQASAYHEFTNRFAAMATIFYTNWEELNQLTLQNVVLPGGGTTSVTIPFEYHNTFDYALGMNFKATEKWVLKAGIDFYNTATNSRDRTPADPIGCATIAAIGVHYQQNPCIGYDLGYAHAFFQNTQMNLVNALTSLTGHSSQNSNVFGAQVTVNFA